MASAELRVQVLWSPSPGELREQDLTLAAGARLVDALRATGWFAAAMPLGELRTGIWGRLQPLDAPLRDADRVEVYRPLTVDPKEARRQRYQASGKRIVTRHRPLGPKR
ncbi:RnfH family protein [Pelomonas sp. CA6]|uniref:RnfH family protein n=1 Tax=Pelomonas sp. CA6 TaxID=2907999 RepID=UPI001F4C4A1B|nr:RnfH family protein [Pelomonas sp. CA6]MCH7345777.1 RnfH family protein [Pelomonas sp. CA6]